MMRPGLLGVTLSLGLVALLASCSPTSAPDPFTDDGGALAPPDAGAGGQGGQAAAGGRGGAAGAAGGGQGPADAGFDPTLGVPCVDDGQCDDAVDCTSDRCDEDFERCRHTPDDSACQNGVVCDGAETCEVKLGCKAGEPVGCSDNDVCTIDACDEAALGACTHLPRDADGDGDADGHCLPDGHDCDDADPNVSSLHAEVCLNSIDDDCDGTVDGEACTAPEHDTCLDPLEIDQPGSYAISTFAAKFDYATACSLSNQATSQDVVAAILLPPGPPLDVEITARTAWPDVSVAIAGQCGDAATEIACSKPYYSPQGGRVAKLRARGLGSPDEPTAYPVYVTTAQAVAATLEVFFLPAEPKAENETCGTAIELEEGVPTLVTIVDSTQDLISMCSWALGDLVYAFTVPATANVDLYASSVDGDGTPTLSLRDPDCALMEDELTCQSQANAHIFRQSMEPGTYYVAVSASAPTTALLTLELSAPTTPEPNENCEGAPPIAWNETFAIDFTNHQDDVATSCFQGAVDAAYALALTETSDVLVVERMPQGDTGGIGIALPACGSWTDQLACTAGSPSPIRVAKHALAPGDYRIFVESLQAQEVELTAFVRPAAAPVLVPFADGCADVQPIPPEGGLFQGNTANVLADFEAGCDASGGVAGGAPDQLLSLTLAETKRVVLDMTGSSYLTLLNVRKGPACPGAEVSKGCTVGYYTGRSYLDLVLQPGVYFVQVDGLKDAKGIWFLDVRVVDP